MGSTHEVEPVEGVDPPRRRLAWVAELDRNPALIERIRKMRRALPGDPGFGDPLSTAGPGGAAAVARLADRFTGASPGATSEASFGLLQLWHAASRRRGGKNGNAEVTVVFTDLVAFSDWSAAAGDEATLELLRAVARLLEPPMTERGGQIVKRLGDGLMVVFDSPVRAVEALLDARRQLAAVEVAGYRPRMRAGLHVGRPRRVGGDWLGVDVNVAARAVDLGTESDIVLTSRALGALGSDLLAREGLWVAPVPGLRDARPAGVPEDVDLVRLVPARG